VDALTTEGKEAYTLDKTNFGVKCGDAFETQHFEGAYVQYSVVIEF